MANVYIDDSIFTSIANAIRVKTGGSSQIAPANMATEIASITVGGGGSVSSIPSWSTGTDNEIAAIIDGYYNGTYTLEEIRESWHVGDIREVSLSAIAASGTYNNESWSVGESHRAQTIKVQIIGFNHDTLTTSMGGKTKALMTVDLKNVLYSSNITSEYSPGSTNGEYGYIDSNMNNWHNSERRSWCNVGFYSALPEYLRTRVKTVNKPTDNYSNLTDKVFLLSEVEVFHERTYSQYTGEGTLYELYEVQANLWKGPIVTANRASAPFYLRSKPNGSSGYEVSMFLHPSYGMSGKGTTGLSGIAPAWCL